MLRKVMLAIGWRPQFLAVWTFPWGCLSILMTWQLASTRVSDERERASEEEAQCLLWSGFRSPRKGEGTRLYLLRRKLPKNLWTYLKMTRALLLLGWYLYIGYFIVKFVLVFLVLRFWPRLLIGSDCDIMKVLKLIKGCWCLSLHSVSLILFTVLQQMSAGENIKYWMISGFHVQQKFTAKSL